MNMYLKQFKIKIKLNKKEIKIKQKLNNHRLKHIFLFDFRCS